MTGGSTAAAQGKMVKIGVGHGCDWSRATGLRRPSANQGPWPHRECNGPDGVSDGT